MLSRLNEANKEPPFYQNEYFLFYFFVLVQNAILAGAVFSQPATTLTRVSVTSLLLLFTALFFWSVPVQPENFRKFYLYLAVQTLLVTLMGMLHLFCSIVFYSLSVQAMAKFKVRTALIWISVFTLITLLLYWYFEGVFSDTFTYNVAVRCASFFFFGAFGGVLARVKRNREEIKYLLAEAVDAQGQLKEYAEQVGTLAAVAERERLARELHDSLGHKLIIAITQLEGARRLTEQNPRRMADMIEVVSEQLNNGLDELRHIVDIFRKRNVNRDNLTHVLQQLVDEFAAATGIVLHTRLPHSPPPLSDAQSMTIYRIVQEALTNTQKHAQALNIWVALEPGDGALILHVRNDGRNFDTSNGIGYGLQGMQERAAQVGGELHVTCPAQGGTLVTLSLPVGETAHAKEGCDRIETNLP